MNRIPFVAAVVGALVVGGATTGTTHASWTDRATASASSITAGRLSYTAGTPTDVTVNKVSGSTADTTITIDDTSLGKNIAQRITAAVGSTPTGVTATVGTTCPGAATAFADMTPTTPDQTFCVRVTSSTTAVSGNVTINLSSVQRPNAGWRTHAITRSFAVTVTNTTPTTPTIVCGTRDNNDIPFTWTAALGETYTVERSITSATTGFVVQTTSGTSPYTVSMATNNSTTWWRVKSVIGSASSSYSNVVKIARGNGASTITCGAPS